MLIYSTQPVEADKAQGVRFYRRFLACSFLGALGDYVTLAALGWYVVDTIDSAKILGWIFFARTVPRFFMSFVGGYLADRFDRRLLLLLVYGGLLLATGLQLAVIWQINHLHWLFLVGVVFLRNAFDSAEPSIRNAILPDIVPKSEIAKAVGLYASSLNLAAIVAPLIVGYTMESLGFRRLLFIDMLLQLPAFFILFGIPRIARDNTEVSNPKPAGYINALRYINRVPLLKFSLLLSIALMLVLFPFSAMMPLYIKNHLHWDTRQYGWLSGAESAGAVLSGMLIAKIGSSKLEKAWQWIGLAACCLLVILSFISNNISVFVIIFLLGLFSQLFRSISRIRFQLHTPTAIRGKVMAVIISDSGFVSLGLLIFTQISSLHSITMAFKIMGIAGLTAILVIYIIAQSRKPSTGNRI
ncbi:MFS transporter [Mucilaginibacter sp. KACC 22063]|uniref:MFS transporter n=1 Tax=Mucilaginibacter sp. KACC 22063 TaxID=3025666 RepID=UPI0023665587|nr:MFS transporter [Mucilaginibacter sp. KACC 22063]WDF55751.1 MFS transporter [Mucilaginibacter sp. KACC 22063]